MKWSNDKRGAVDNWARDSVTDHILNIFPTFEAKKDITFYEKYLKQGSLILHRQVNEESHAISPGLGRQITELTSISSRIICFLVFITFSESPQNAISYTIIRNFSLITETGHLFLYPREAHSTPHQGTLPIYCNH